MTGDDVRPKLAVVITLFGNLESGNVHKVQMLFHWLAIPYNRVEVSQVRGEPRRPEFLRINRMGKVPVVILDDGDVMSESGAILYWFAQGTRWWPEERRSRAEVLRWMFFEQYSHEPALAVLRYARRFASAGETTSSRMEELSAKANRAIEV